MRKWKKWSQPYSSLTGLTNYWRWINTYPPHSQLHNIKLILPRSLVQVQWTVMIMTAVVVSWEKETVTSLIHNATSRGSSAFWSIFWYCYCKDWYLALLRDGLVSMQNVKTWNSFYYMLTTDRFEPDWYLFLVLHHCYCAKASLTYDTMLFTSLFSHYFNFLSFWNTTGNSRENSTPHNLEL